MKPEDLLPRLRAKPFLPFRLCFQGGLLREIRNPAMLILWKSGLLVAHPSNVDGIAERIEMFGWASIERVEPVVE